MADKSMGETVIKAIFLILFIILAVVGNILVCIAIRKYKRLRTMTNYYVFNLAIADLLYGLTGMPFLLITSIAGEWTLGSALCQLSGTLQTLFVLVSIWTLCLIGVNRYFAVGQHTSYRSIYKKKRVLVSIGCVWLIAGLISVAPHFGWSSIRQGDNFCTINGKDDISYSIFVIIFAYIGPLICLIGLYTKIFFLLRQHEKKMLAIRGGSTKATRSETDFDSADYSSAYKTDNYKMDNYKMDSGVHDIRFDNISSLPSVNPPAVKLKLDNNIPTGEDSTVSKNGGEVNSNGIDGTQDQSIDGVETPDQNVDLEHGGELEQDNVKNGHLGSAFQGENQDDRSNMPRTTSASGSGIQLMVDTAQAAANVTYHVETRGEEDRPPPRKARTFSGIANVLRIRRSTTSSKKIKKFRSEARITKMLFVVVAVFFVCWTPLVIGTVLYALNANPRDFNLLSLGFMFASMNSICNPIIYAFMNQPFRKAFKDLFIGCKSNTEDSRTET